MCRYSGDKYTTCPTEQDGDHCNLNIFSMVLYPIIIYVLWQVLYIVWVSLQYELHIRRCMYIPNSFITVSDIANSK